MRRLALVTVLCAVAGGCESNRDNHGSGFGCGGQDCGIDVGYGIVTCPWGEACRGVCTWSLYCVYPVPQAAVYTSCSWDGCQGELCGPAGYCCGAGFHCARTHPGVEECVPTDRVAYCAPHDAAPDERDAPGPGDGGGPVDADADVAQ
jgi:hypothetical protein